MQLSLYLYPVANDAQSLPKLWDRFEEQISHSSRCGWRGVWTPEHHVARAFFPPPLQLLTWIAARFPTQHVGTAVALAPLYHPLHLAEGIAALASLTDRLVIGFGTGFRRREFDANGVHQEKKKDLAVEIVRTVRKLLNGEEVTFEQGPWRGHGARLPFAVSKPPQFLAAARTRAELEAFFSVADGVIPNPMGGFDGQLALLDDFDALAGQVASNRVVLADLVYGRTREKARERAARRLGAEFGSFRHQQAKVPEIARFAEDPAGNVDLVRKYAIVGTEDEVAERLTMLAQSGVTEVVLRPEQAATNQEEVLEAIEVVGAVHKSLPPEKPAVPGTRPGGRL